VQWRGPRAHPPQADGEDPPGRRQRHPPALGTKLPLETLDGPAEIDVRPGTQSGHAITLRGRGIQHLRGAGRGDLIVHVEVKTPSKLDPEQEELLRRLAKLRGEERPAGEFAPGQQKLFSRLRDAFNAR
jgi:molecular chaperone DnaJ